LTGAIVTIDLARRRASVQGDDEFGTFLGAFAQDVGRDQLALRGVVKTLGVSARLSRELLGTATAWLDSIRGTLNMPGAPNLVGDIEMLTIGVRGKELIWKSLQRMER
jgi:hypothetical protein